MSSPIFSLLLFTSANLKLAYLPPFVLRKLRAASKKYHCSKPRNLNRDMAHNTRIYPFAPIFPMSLPHKKPPAVVVELCVGRLNGQVLIPNGANQSGRSAPPPSHAERSGRKTGQTVCMAGAGFPSFCYLVA